MEITMEKDRSRAIRRHHIARLKNVREKYFAISWWSNRVKRIGMLVQYPKICSCASCGNGRKWRGERTLDELRGFDIMEDGIDEYYTDIEE
jgi:hypothetical protein